MLVQKTIEHRHNGYCMQFWSASTKNDIEEVERRMKGLIRSTESLIFEEGI